MNMMNVILPQQSIDVSRRSITLKRAPPFALTLLYDFFHCGRAIVFTSPEKSKSIGCA